MDRDTIKALKANYEHVVHCYGKAFARKHGLEYREVGWTYGEVGGTLEIGDRYFEFDDIRTDIDRDAPVGEIEHWDDYCLRARVLSDRLATPGYGSWLRGCSRIDDGTFERLEKLKQDIEDAEKRFREEVGNAKISRHE